MIIEKVAQISNLQISKLLSKRQLLFQNREIICYQVILSLLRIVSYFTLDDKKLILMIFEIGSDLFQVITCLYYQPKNNALQYGFYSVLNKLTLISLIIRTTSSSHTFLGQYLLLFQSDLYIYLGHFQNIRHKQTYLMFSSLSFIILTVAMGFLIRLDSNYLITTLIITSLIIVPKNLKYLTKKYDKKELQENDKFTTAHKVKTRNIFYSSPLMKSKKFSSKNNRERDDDHQISIENYLKRPINNYDKYITQKQNEIIGGQIDIDEGDFVMQGSDQEIKELNFEHNKRQKFNSQDSSTTPLDEVKWNQRMNLMPFGIAIINWGNKENSYTNKNLIDLLKKHTIFDEDNVENHLFYNLSFKLIQWSNDVFKSKTLLQIWNYRDERRFQNGVYSKRLSDSSTPLQSRSYIKDLELSSNQTFTIAQIINKYENNQLSQYLNKDDNTVELYCLIESKCSAKNNQIFLTCKLLVPTEKDDSEYTLIVQDFTRQRQYQQIEEENEYKTKVYLFIQRKLIGSFSHELRTPLNSSILFLRACLLDDTTNNYLKNKFILPSLSSLQIQESLIQDIIDFSQINANQLELKFTTFALNELIDDVVDLFKFQISMKKMGLAFDIEPTVPYKITNDYKRLMQVLINLISNSIKFSQNGYIIIRIYAGEAQEITFKVQDEGLGIDYIRLLHIRRVLQGELKGKQQWTGKKQQSFKGFGLCISQMLLRILGSFETNTLILESGGTDLGTCVSFNISNNYTKDTEFIQTISLIKKNRHNSVPNLNQFYGKKHFEYLGLILKIRCLTESTLLFKRSELKTNSQMVAELDNVDLEKSKQRALDQNSDDSPSRVLNYQTDKYKRIEQDPEDLEKLQQQQSKICKCQNILSVDDEIFNQSALSLILQNFGFTVDTAFNGLQAIDMINKRILCCRDCCIYRLILMDCSMPVMDGWQATQILIQKMEMAQIPKIPIIGLTAFTSKSDIDQCIQSGMNDVLQKPLQMKRFNEIMVRYKLK